MNTSMKNALFDLGMVTFGITVVSCLGSLMAIFMGSYQSDSSLQGLVSLQVLLATLAAIAVAEVVRRFVVASGWAQGLTAIWLALPQWLVFIFLLLNSLFLFGEIAFVIVMQATEEVVTWQEHVPLVALLFCSSAFLALYARKNSYPGSVPAMAGRWMDN